MMCEAVVRDEVIRIYPEQLNPSSHQHAKRSEESLLDWDRVMELREISQRGIAELDRLSRERDRRGRWVGFSFMFRW